MGSMCVFKEKMNLNGELLKQLAAPDPRLALFLIHTLALGTILHSIQQLCGS